LIPGERRAYDSLVKRIIPFLLLAGSLLAQQDTTFEGYAAIELANDKISVIVNKTGGGVTRIVLQNDPGENNPIWNPARMSRELGEERKRVGGHFICVDGFGPVSKEEAAAGLPGHGEVHNLEMDIVSSGAANGQREVTLRAKLPVVQEIFTRSYTVVDGENVVYVDSELENLLGFDRPIEWAEHATIGSPFLAPEVTVVDLSAGRSQVRPRPKGTGRRHRLKPGEDFAWPMAPAFSGGGLEDVRIVPREPGSSDHTTSLMDPNREHQFVTALHREKRLLLGYVFRHQEFPWLQTWDAYSANLKLARGLEFSTQPYDVPRRQAISTGTMWGAPTYRWLPAKSTITARFLMFYTEVPEGFLKVDDIRLVNGELIIEDRDSGKTVTLAASQGL